MKRKKLEKQLQAFVEKLGLTDSDPNVVGYALFNKEKRAFVVLTDGDYDPTDVYTGDLDDAFIANDMADAFGSMMGLEDAEHIVIVPVIYQELFGLTVEPGALDKSAEENL